MQLESTETNTAVNVLKGVENQVALLLDQRATGSGYRQR
jgi:hypothetical protein